MSARDYFHAKAEESQPNEIVGYIMFLAGSVFFVGGVLAALTVSSQPSWFLFIPYNSTSMQAMILELSFLVVGLSLIVAGITSGLHFYRDRSMYMQELFKAKDSDDLLRDFRAQTAAAKRNNKA